MKYSGNAVLFLALAAGLQIMPRASIAQTKLRASYAGTTGHHLPIWV
jgi:hypothetical protein